MQDESHGGAAAPLPEYSDDGVDLSLIRWMLSLTPGERLKVLQDHIDAVWSIREWNASAK